MEKSKGRQRISWKNPELLKFFLEQCIREVSQCGRQGTSLKPGSWPRVSTAIEEKFGRKVTQKQMKNEYDYLKEKYYAWVVLASKRGYVYDSQTNTFNLTPEEWDNCIKTLPKAKSLRTQGLAYLELCKELFDGIMPSLGSRCWGPSCTKPKLGTRGTLTKRIYEENVYQAPQLPRPDTDRIQTLVLPPPVGLPHTVGNNAFNENGETPPTLRPDTDTIQTAEPSIRVELGGTAGNNLSNENEDQAPQTPGAQSSATNSITKERANKRRKKTCFFELEGKFTEVLELLLSRNSGPSIADCTKKLERLRWDHTNPLYLTALGIFCEGQNYRDCWMVFSDDDIGAMEGWITLVGRRLGFG